MSWNQDELASSGCDLKAVGRSWRWSTLLFWFLWKVEIWSCTQLNARKRWTKADIVMTWERRNSIRSHESIKSRAHKSVFLSGLLCRHLEGGGGCRGGLRSETSRHSGPTLEASGRTRTNLAQLNRERRCKSFWHGSTWRSQKHQWDRLNGGTVMFSFHDVAAALFFFRNMIEELLNKSEVFEQSVTVYLSRQSLLGKYRLFTVE